MKMKNRFALSALAALSLLSVIACQPEKQPDGGVIAEEEAVFPLGGGSLDISVAAEGAWSVTDSGADWVSVVNPEGNGAGMFTIIVDSWDNVDNEESRETVLTYSAEGAYSAKISVRQLNDDNFARPYWPGGVL